MQGLRSMRKFTIPALAASTAAIAVASIATPAFAQSTGAVEFEKAIVVSGKTNRSLAGVDLPATSKAKEVLDQSFISQTTPGQSINDTINMIPGVASFNADPFGSSGGTLYIRGFDNSRISETFDGMPLNDTGNYALYSNQMLDAELIDNVNVNLGSTDVDSPTASATGSTVNYRSRNPTEDFHARVIGSTGDFGFMRIFGVVDTGNITKGGLRAWLAASKETYDVFSGGVGKINKEQFNFKVYQPLGDNGDFVSLAGHWNQNRNANSPKGYLFNMNYGSRVVSGASSGRFPLNMSEVVNYNLGNCTTITSTSCGNAREYIYNPSDTGNLRMNMRFTLTDKLLLTIDPSVQYVKANGGASTTTASELTCTTAACSGATTGYIGGSYYVGNDINGDGISSNSVRIVAPSMTQTWRLGVIASLRYLIDENNTIRIGYTYDRGRHHQTGELATLAINGFASSYFPVDNPIRDSSGNIIEKRNRMSYAILHQVSGEYAGRFLDNRLSFNVGVRVPFLRRDLTNNCFTTSQSGFVDCPANASMNAAYAAAHTGYAAPQTRVIDYNRVLPNAGITFNFTPRISMFANYSKGLQVPGTDSLYNAFYYPVNDPRTKPSPETTDNYDVGVRYRSGKILAQASGWYTLFQNRLASSWDDASQTTIYRNLGTVERYGVDLSVSWSPIKQFSLYAFGSYLKSRIVSDVSAGTCTSFAAAAAIGAAKCVGTEAYYLTAGKRESGAPVTTAGISAEGHFGIFDLTANVKRTGRRYLNDQNLPDYVGTTAANAVVAYKAAAPAYTTVDLMLRAKLETFGAPKNTFLQFNLLNVFNQYYVGGFDGATSAFGSAPTTQAWFPTPRTFTGTLSVAF